MIKAGNYCIEQYANQNKLTIYLPQTYQTMTNTVQSVENRKIILNNDEMMMLLEFAKKLYEQGVGE